VEAVVQATQESVEQVALRSDVPVAGGFASVVVCLVFRSYAAAAAQARA
jgi:hypothetical protein